MPVEVSSRTFSGGSRSLARLLIIAAAYYGAARLGLRYASVGESISLVWPSAGIAIALLVLWGRGLWPGVALGAFAANAATDVPLAAAAGIAIGNTTGALLGATVFRRLVPQGARGLEELRAVRSFAFVAVPAAAFTAAVIGVLSLQLGGELALAGVPTALASWWAGDFVGALIVGSLILSWADRPRVTGPERRVVEAAFVFLGTVAVAQVALAPLVDQRTQIQGHYLLFPFVIWAASRFGIRGASLTTLTVALVGVWNTARGGGPFVAATDAGTLLALAAYLGVVALTGLLLAAAVNLERVEATGALRQAEERLRLALDAARLGVWVWSMESDTLFWDENLRRLYGLGPRETVTTFEGFLNRVHPEDRAFVATSVARAREHGTSLDYEFRILLPDGSVRWIADQGKLLRDAAGRTTHMTGVCHDVTERRMAEERLRLAHRMDSVGRLAGGVAHEANNQMSIVLGATHFLLSRPEVTGQVRSDVEQIRRAAERTAAVTAQLLAFSRRQVLNPVSLDLSAVVRQWEDVLRRVMGADCTVVFRLAAGPGRVRADAGQLQQVLLNLALNARDAMPTGGTLTIDTFATTLGDRFVPHRPGVDVRRGEYMALAVSDTGSGMDRGTLERIFEPFFTTKPVGKGTGLGLATVYGIVKQSGGYVWAYSEPGMGSTFKIYLPLETAGTDEVPVPAQPPALGLGEVVLLVEDDTVVREFTRRVLEGAGFTVVEAADGARALAVLKEATEPIAAVLTDLVMPGMTGQELGRRIGELKPGLPVLFTSGYTDAEIGRRGLADPDTPFLQKPASAEAVARFIREHIPRERPTESTIP